MNSVAGIFIGSFVIGLSGAMMPGPMFVVVVGQTPRRGFWTGPLVVLGHGVLESLLVGALILGMAEFFSSSAVLSAVAAIGGAVLLYMAVDMLRSAGKLTLIAEAGSGARDMHPVLAGVLTSLANPYWLIWWLTIGLGYVLFAAKFGLPGVFLFFGGHILADLAWYSLVSATVAWGRNFFTDGLYRGFLAGCGCFLFLFSVYFGVQGVKFLLNT